MAKKAAAKKAAKPSGRTPRKETYNKQRMTAVVDRLKELSAKVNGLMKGMDDAGVDRIEVDGHAMLLRGINQIENFIDNSTRSIREAKNRSTKI
jgi:hypothetical protein